MCVCVFYIIRGYSGLTPVQNYVVMVVVFNYIYIVPVKKSGNIKKNIAF